MDQNDRQAIEGLFDKLAQVEQSAPARDSEAEAFIAQTIARQPGAPYYMAQTVVVQEQALNAAQHRIEALEAQLAQSQQAQGGFLSRLLGGPAAAPAPVQQSARRGVPQVRQGQQPGQGGGFLAGAAQTAVGVAGGMMLGNMLGGMFAGEAAAATPEEETPFEDEDAMSFDDGGDWGGE